MIRPFLAATLLFVFACAGISPAHALEAIGKVTALEGEAFAYRAGEPVFKLSEEDQLFEGDMIETAPDGEAHLSMLDGTEITIDNDTALELTAYSYTPGAGKKNRSLMDLVRGSALYLSGELSKGGGTSSIKTGYGSLGIRGTEFWVGERVTDMGKGLGVFVEDGEVEVRNWSGSVRVGKGLGTNIYGHGARPGKPRAWGAGARAKTFEKMKKRRAELKQRRKERIRRNIEKIQQKTREHQEMKQKRREDMQQKFQQRQKKSREKTGSKPQKYKLRD